MSSSYSFTSSSTSSTSTNGQTHTHSQTTKSQYNDRDGGFSERTTSETGQPTIVETATIPSSTSDARGLESADGTQRIEDVTDDQTSVESNSGSGVGESEADKRYLEAMEEEYAKREGGA